MPAVLPSTPSNKKFVSIPQAKFPDGYVSTLSGSRVPLTALTRMTNIWLEQDSVPRPRPGFWNYGEQTNLTILGVGTFTKIILGIPEYWEIAMLSNGTNGNIYVRKDGGTWTAVDNTKNFDAAARTRFCQASALTSTNTESRRVYFVNGVNHLAYYDVNSNGLVVSAALSNPSAPTVAPTALSGSIVTQYYVVTAYNAMGETAASANGSAAIGTVRSLWASGSYITVSWSAVTGATGYNVYTGTDTSHLYYIGSTTGLSLKDTGVTDFPVNSYRQAPSGNTTSGPVGKKLYNYNNQLFLIGNPDAPQRVLYSGTGVNLGIFGPVSQGASGGTVDIDFGGSTIPSDVFGFHSGQGTSYPSILTYGPNGRGKLYHLVNQQLSIGGTSIDVLLSIESGSQDGTPSMDGTVIYNNAAHYLTGTTFKTTGIKPGVINILSTDTEANQIIPDLLRINQNALRGVVGIEFQGRLYFALPVDGSPFNNVIWILDMTRNGLWILEWRIRADDMWLYQDNAGIIHFCILNNNTVMELDYSRQHIAHADNGFPFTAVVSGGDQIFGQGGVEMFSSYHTYFKFLHPSGVANIQVRTLNEDSTNEVFSDKFDITAANSVSRISWNAMRWSAGGNEKPLTWDSEVKAIVYTLQDAIPVDIEVSAIVNQQGWSITTNTVGADYLLSGVTTTGYTIPMLYMENNTV